MKEINFKLIEQFMYMQWLMTRYFHQSFHMNEPIRTPFSGQGKVLMLLKMKPETTQKELLEMLGMRSQSLGELLSKLEKNGYIIRSQSETDKRVVVIKLTEKGKNADDPRKRFENAKDIFGCLSEDEQEQFGSFLNRIIEDLEKEFPDDDKVNISGHGCHGHGFGPRGYHPFKGRSHF